MNKRFLSVLAIGSLVLSMGASCNKSSSGDEGSETEGNWIKKAVFGGNVRANATAFVIGDSVAYVGTGIAGSSQDNILKLNDFWKFVPTGNANYGAWTQVADMPAGRYWASAFSIGSKGYVGTGYTDSTATTLKDFYEYDSQTDFWTKKADFPGIARKQAVGFTLNGEGYIGTGLDINSNPLGDFYKYNPSSGSWTAVTSFPGDKRYGAVAFTHDGLAYVVTGIGSSGTTTNDFFSFDGTNWTQLRKIANVSSETYDDNYTDIVRSGAVAFVIGDWAYLATGGSQKTWAYRFSDDHWERRTPYVQLVRSYAVGFAIGSLGYVGTGNASGTKTANFSAFDPTQDYDENADK